jgi:hypothetical protein
MLVGMDISPAGPWITPWLVAAVVSAAVVLVVAGVLLVRRGRNGGPPGVAGSPPGFEDDLPGFLESPPGSAGEPVPPAAGWPLLAAAPPPAPRRPPGPPGGAARRTALAAGTLLVIALLVLAVVTLATRPGARGPDRAGHGESRTAHAPPASEAPAPDAQAPGAQAPEAPLPGDPGAGELADATVAPGRDGGAARLAFGGLVLEQRAVGITATYPVVEVAWDRRQGVAHVRLPTFNCLTAEAPEDPVAAGCAASMPEYADLPMPALDVSGNGGTVLLSGRFPTYVRPNGSPPEWTGRVYEFRVEATPVDGAPDAGWVPAEGEIRLGSGSASTLSSPDVTVLRRD